jgi:hypothetical protein
MMRVGVPAAAPPPTGTRTCSICIRASRGASAGAAHGVETCSSARSTLAPRLRAVVKGDSFLGLWSCTEPGVGLRRWPRHRPVTSPGPCLPPSGRVGRSVPPVPAHFSPPLQRHFDDPLPDVGNENSTQLSRCRRRNHEPSPADCRAGAGWPGPAPVEKSGDGFRRGLQVVRAN